MAKPAPDTSTRSNPNVGSAKKRYKIVRDLPFKRMDEYRTVPNIGDVKKGKKPQTKLPPPPSNWH
jgi:hypothetical protein